MRQKRIQTEDFFLGNLGSPESSDEILNACPQELMDFDEATTGGEDIPNHINRQCLVSWLDVTACNFIEHGLRKILGNVNDMIWKFPLKGEWDCNIQFTKYCGVGHHYDWHIDNFQGDCADRRLSIVYCLSKKTAYGGAEFDIEKRDGSVYTTKFDYGDFIVFPSDTYHRVRPMKSGSRITMVGWYR